MGGAAGEYSPTAATVTVSMPSTSSSSLESNMTQSVRSPVDLGFTENWHRTSPPTGTVLGKR